MIAPQCSSRAGVLRFLAAATAGYKRWVPFARPFVRPAHSHQDGPGRSPLGPFSFSSSERPTGSP